MKFLFDKIISAIGLIVLLPIMALISFLIKLKMPDGPVIFKQDRVGRKGEIFTIYKFRTMSDSCVTPLGARLRRFKLDELPQLWNILKGDMSFVGPRPDVPGYADVLTGDDREILELRPGVTGPASLKYRDEEEMLAMISKSLEEGTEILDKEGHAVNSVVEYNDRVIFPDKVRLNRLYFHHRSLWLDIKLIVATVLRLHISFCGELI
ncbi:MAG: sugar transferase [Bacteroidales bacterium]|nr:sugar transferase [Bacteroidales bacterium]